MRENAGSRHFIIGSHFQNRKLINTCKNNYISISRVAFGANISIHPIGSENGLNVLVNRPWSDVASVAKNTEKSAT